MATIHELLENLTEDNIYEIARGRISGATVWNKFGYNNDVDTGTEAVWSQGGAFTYLTTASTVNVVSTSAQDTLTTGTGAWTVLIYGVDSNWDDVIEVVVMNGTNNVESSNSYYGINRMVVYNTGTNDSNVGTITATATSNATVQAHMPAGEGTTQQCLFTIQKEHTAMMAFVVLNALKLSGGGGSPRVTFKLWAYSHVTGSKYEVARTLLDTDIENTIPLPMPIPLVFTGRQTIWWEATTDTNNTEVGIRFSLVEYDDNI